MGHTSQKLLWGDIQACRPQHILTRQGEKNLPCLLPRTTPLHLRLYAAMSIFISNKISGFASKPDNRVRSPSNEKLSQNQLMTRHELSLTLSYIRTLSDVPWLAVL